MSDWLLLIKVIITEGLPSNCKVRVIRRRAKRTCNRRRSQRRAGVGSVRSALGMAARDARRGRGQTTRPCIGSNYLRVSHLSGRVGDDDSRAYGSKAPRQ